VAAYIDNEDDLIYSEIAAAKLASSDQASTDSGEQGAVAETPTEEKAAYAVAAAGASSASSVEPVPGVPQLAPVAEPVSQEQVELEDAWEHWKQVRESVVNPEFTSQVAQAAAEGVQENQASASEAEAPADTSSEANEIANIVDSVLADLKPRLMEEISKKMGKKKK